MTTPEPAPAAPEPQLVLIPPNVDWFATALRWIVVAQTHDVTMTPDGPRATPKEPS